MKPRSVHVRWETGLLSLCVGWSTVGCGDRAQLDFGTVRHPDEGASSVPLPSNLTPAPGAALPPVIDGTSASAPPAPSTFVSEPVTGRVTDFWGHPVPHVALDVDGRLVTTNQQGEFEVLDVGDVYDVSLVVHIDGEAQEAYGWTFEGLTRRALTLPIFRGLPPKRATVEVRSLGSNDGSVPCGVTAMGGKHGHDVFGLYPELKGSVVWRGLDAIDLNVQTLFWQPLVAGDCGVPGRYVGFQQAKLALVPGTAAALDLAGLQVTPPVSAKTVRGAVWSNEVSSLDTSVFVRFEDGATLPVLASQVAGQNPNAFTYMAPTIEGTSLVIAVSRGGIGAPDYAVAFEERSGAAEQEVELWLPEPPIQLEPSTDERVAPFRTPFSWRHDDVSLLAVVQDDAFVGQYVVTANSETTLRDLSHLGFRLPVEVPHRWTVEVHRAVSTVDEWLETPGGGLNPFSSDFNVPVGPHVGRGSFSRSTVRTVVFASE